MTKEQKEKWIEALRSGEYKQGKHFLKTTDEKYCCLGVFCVINGLEISLNSIDGYPENDYTFIKTEMDVDNMDTLIFMNDTEEADFEEIANYIEQNIQTND